MNHTCYRVLQHLPRLIWSRVEELGGGVLIEQAATVHITPTSTVSKTMFEGLRGEEENSMIVLGCRARGQLSTECNDSVLQYPEQYTG